jgi:hypothetical protein
MFRSPRKSSFTLLAALAAASVVRADITVLHHWKLGESDGADPAITKDSVGTLDLTLTGTTARVASTVPGSTLAMEIANTWGPYPTAAQSFATNLTTPIVLPDPANWGFECWAWQDSLPGAGVDSESTFVHIGDHTSGGEVMELLSGTYFIHLPGVTLADSTIQASLDVGKWVHLAMVNQQEYTVDNAQSPPVITATGVRKVHLYRNGVEIASTNGAPSGGTKIVTVGAQKLSGNGGLQQSRGINGKMDDVRIFTFALGSFNPATDLLYPNGPTTAKPFLITDVSLGGNGAVTLKWNSQTGKTYSVWESTDLSTWLENSDAIASGGAETSTVVSPLNTASPRVYFRVHTP